MRFFDVCCGVQSRLLCRKCQNREGNFFVFFLLMRISSGFLECCVERSFEGMFQGEGILGFGIGVCWGLGGGCYSGGGYFCIIIQNLLEKVVQFRIIVQIEVYTLRVYRYEKLEIKVYFGLVRVFVYVLVVRILGFFWSFIGERS